MYENIFKLAINEAKKAYKNNEIPVGAVLVKNGKIIAKSHNNRQKRGNILGHAEINCILKAEKYENDWRLNDYELYVTLEPCKMCEIIILESRISKVFYLNKQKNKNFISNNNFIQTNVRDELKVQYDNLLSDFFSKLRNKL